MKDHDILDQLIAQNDFCFKKLSIASINNEPVFKLNRPEMRQEEICLFHNSIHDGDTYLSLLDQFIAEKMQQKKPAPVVRFADGEYAFYMISLDCNGLYQQAESKKVIKSILPVHIAALKTLSQTGKLAPLIFPGNSEPLSGFSWFGKKKAHSSARYFLSFMENNQILLNKDNYIPFYAIYAYLTSTPFLERVNGKKVCILNSDCNQTSCQNWFSSHNSYPELTFVDIPDSYVATRWPEMKKQILPQIPQNTDLVLVGAGIGSLLVCVDVATNFSCPAFDAGHVLNMMNDLEGKSNGPRLYTIRKPV